MARFVTSVSKSGDSSELSDLCDIALVGPSNAGKSSLINALARKKIALISNKPGKTRTLNFYDFDSHYLVDTPGYGFAEGSKSSREQLLTILNNYFSGTRAIVGVLQIVSSHGLTNKDLEVYSYLINRFHNYSLLINKTDKISKNKQKLLLDEVIALTKLNPEAVLMISAKERINIGLVNQRIKEFLI